MVEEIQEPSITIRPIQPVPFKHNFVLSQHTFDAQYNYIYVSRVQKLRSTILNTIKNILIPKNTPYIVQKLIDIPINQCCIVVGVLYVDIALAL